MELTCRFREYDLSRRTKSACSCSCLMGALGELPWMMTPLLSQ